MAIYTATLKGTDVGVVGVTVTVQEKDCPLFERITAQGRETGARVRANIDNKSDLRVELGGENTPQLHYDLAIVLAILKPEITASNVAVLGELHYSGQVREVNGIVPMARALKGFGFTHAIVPRRQAESVALTGLTPIPVATLDQALKAWGGELPERKEVVRPAVAGHLNFLDVACPRELEIALAGGHGILLSGRNAAYLARRAPALLEMGDEVQCQVTDTYSIVGLLSHDGAPCVTLPPFRAPHFTISEAGFAGYRNRGTPGEVALAHGGVLFLDEVGEFRFGPINAVKRIIRGGVTDQSRAEFQAVYPSQPQIIAAAKRCPCGRLGTWSACHCPAESVAQFHAHLLKVSRGLCTIHADLSGKLPAPIESTEVVRARIQAARAAQNKRQGCLNASLRRLEPREAIAATIADLEGAETISGTHRAEAKAITIDFREA